MSACYRSEDSIEKSNKCAEDCHEVVRKAQTEVQAHVEEIQHFFQHCMQNCKIAHFKNENESKECIINCTDQAGIKFMNARKISQKIMSTYNSFG